VPLEYSSGYSKFTVIGRAISDTAGTTYPPFKTAFKVFDNVVLASTYN
jgi:hypothetical protein